MRAKLSIGFEGEVAVPPREAEALGLAPGDPVDVVTARGAFLLAAPAREGRSAKSFFAGSLAFLTVAEVVHLVFTSLRTGVLLLSFGDEAARAGGPAVPPERLRRRSIYFRDGQVVFASSSEACERLGPVLWRHGLAPWAEIERCGRLVRSGRPLGQALVDEAVLSAAQIYDGIARQVKEILLAAFLETEGEFTFLEGPADEATAVKLGERTHDLLLEGLRRVEEAGRLLADVGGREAVLARSVEPPPGMGELAARLMRSVDGTRPLSEVAVASGLGLMEALRQAAPLVAAGVLVPAAFTPRPRGDRPAAVPAPAVTPLPATLPAVTPVPGILPSVTPLPGAPPAAGGAPARPGGPFETYRRIFRRVVPALRQVEPDAAARLDGYLDRLPERKRAVFEGVRFGAGGDIDVGRVLANVTATGLHRGAAAKARSLEALEELLSFALFEVKNRLPRAQAEALLREVGRMQVGKA